MARAELICLFLHLIKVKMSTRRWIVFHLMWILLLHRAGSTYSDHWTALAKKLKTLNHCGDKSLCRERYALSKDRDMDDPAEWNTTSVLGPNEMTDPL